MTQLRTRLAGLLATLTLLALVAGTPAVLVRATPVFLARASLPTHWTPQQLWSLLLRPDDGTLLVLLLVGVCWAAWAILVLLVLVETVALLRGIQAPHLPGLPQAAARRLVTTAMLLFLAAPHLPTPTAIAAPTDTVQVAPTVDEHTYTDSAAAAPASRPDTVEHVVKRGESLWSIAERHLGDGARFTEIVDLNPDLLDGRPNFLRPGWTLQLPTPTAVQAGATLTYTVERGDTLSEIAADRYGDPSAYPAIAEASRHIEQPGGRRLVDPDLIDVGWTLNLPPLEDEPAATTPPTAEATPSDPAPTDTPSDPAPVPAEVTTQPAGTGAVPAMPTTASVPTAATPRTPVSAASGTPVVVDEADVPEESVPPAWQLAGLTGAGAVLAASMWTVLRRRRAAQFRARRPGRMIASTPDHLIGVEKTLATVGRRIAPTTEFMDSCLRRLATTQARSGQPMPPVVAVQLVAGHVILHLAARQEGEVPVPPAPWQPTPDRAGWQLRDDVDPDTLGDLDVENTTPYPQLVAWGNGADDSIWLVNLEHAGVITVTGPDQVVDDFARYLIAEIAMNPWSRDVTVTYAGLGADVGRLNPRRVHHHPDGLHHAAGRVLAGALLSLDRLADATREHGSPTDLATARAHLLGTELWDGRLLVTTGDEPRLDAIAELGRLITTHPDGTGTALLNLNGTPVEGGWHIALDADQRLHARPPLPDLTAVGLPEGEAEGCAALLTQADDTTDTEIPDLPTLPDDEPEHIDLAGQLHAELTLPRELTPTEPAASLLPEPDARYLSVAATTSADLAALAPHVPDRVRDSVADADPDLDDDLAAWYSDGCPLPRLTVLGPLHLRVAATGSPEDAAGRHPQLLDLLAFLATRPVGATTAEVARAVNTAEPRVRKNLTILRKWLGANPATGQPHIPDARATRAAARRGQPAYEVEGLLVDADLFRRLRVRAQTRGPAGIPDLEEALALVQGAPYSQLRDDGGTWLLEGDRHDHILAAAIVDVAHTIATARLHEGNLDKARAAATTALRAVPDDETAQLDLAAILAAEGDLHATRQHLLQHVFGRSDDEDPTPTDWPDRTQQIIDSHHWFDRHRRTAG